MFVLASVTLSPPTRTTPPPTPMPDTPATPAWPRNNSLPGGAVRGAALADGGAGNSAAGSAGPAICLIGGDRGAGAGLFGTLFRSQPGIDGQCRRFVQPDAAARANAPVAAVARAAADATPTVSARGAVSAAAADADLADAPTDHPRRHWPGWPESRL